jgi:hypothetical protein
MNLRDKETQLLSKMLNLSAPSTTGLTVSAAGDFSDQWKVLVYDQDGKDVISPLMNVPLLRQKGVTLHLQLHSEREPIPDAPVVYFVRPTEANIKRIADDCGKQLYRIAYVNFISRVDRSMLELLARELISVNAMSSVARIYDQYLDVIALEPNLFTLNIKDSFSLYNEPSLSEERIRSFMSRVAMGLLSAVRVMGTLPIIRAPRGGAAEMLAREVNTLLRENITPRGSQPSLLGDCLVQAERSRPLLLITDRMIDLFPILQHTSTYQALISDLLDFRLNRVAVDIDGGNKLTAHGASNSNKKKNYDLNSSVDNFLQRYAASPFPEAVENNEKELAEVSSLEQSIRSRHPASMLTTVENDNGNLENKGRDLSEAIESLPAIMQRKTFLEAHTNLMQAVMKQIAARDIPTFFEMEQALLTNGVRNMDRTALLNLLRDGQKGTLHDKARLLAVLAALGDSTSLSKVGAEEYDVALQQGCAMMVPTPPSPAEIAQTLAALAFLRRLLSLQQAVPSMMSGGGGRDSMSTITARATSLIAKAAAFFTKFTPYTVTRLVHTLAEGRGGAEDESFLYLDPRAREDSTQHPMNVKYNEAVVFVLGGGSYSEYFNLQELLKEKASSGSAGSLRSIVYGCSDLLAGEDFMLQLERLAAGQRSGAAAGGNTAATAR